MPHSLEQLVDRQIVRWEEESRLSGRPVDLPPGAPHRPVITISRETGSAGDAVAELVARRLGFHVFGRELVDYIAAEAHVQRRVVETLDERVQAALEESLKQQLGAETLTRGEYLHDLSRVVMALAIRGRAVFVGRGAQFILDPRWTLRIRTIGPGPRTAVDRERDDFCRRCFGRDPSDPRAYDLVVHTGSLSIEACADGIVAVFQNQPGWF